jgi:CHAD domain-containing protein
MPSSCLQRTYDAEASKIRKLAARSGKTFGFEEVHDLRVEVKRLRALLDVIEHCRPGFPVRERFKPFRKLFKAAGGLREAQVASSLAREKAVALQLDLDAYRNLLKSDELRERKKFSAAAKAFRRRSLGACRKAIDRALDVMGASSVQTAVEARLDELRRKVARLKRPKPVKRELHLLRIRSKRMHDTLEILQRCFRPDDTELEALSESLRAVHQALGRWHDLELAANSLRVFLRKRAVRPLAGEGAYAEYERALRVDRRRYLAGFKKAWEGLVRQPAFRTSAK